MKILSCRKVPLPSPTKGTPLVSPCMNAGVLRGGADKPLSNMRREWVRPFVKQWMPQWMPVIHQLWNDLQPYHARLPALTIYLVKYPRQVEYIIPPISVILTIVDDLPDGETFRLHVLHAAKSLVMAQPS